MPRLAEQDQPTSWAPSLGSDSPRSSVVKDADAQLAASRAVLESLRRGRSSFVKAGVPSRGGGSSPVRNNGPASSAPTDDGADSDERVLQLHLARESMPPAPANVAASPRSVRDLPPSIVQKAMDSPRAGDGPANGGAPGAGEEPTDPELLMEENEALREECRRLQRVLDASNRRRRTVETDSQGLRVEVSTLERKVAELTVERDEARVELARRASPDREAQQEDAAAAEAPAEGLSVAELKAALTSMQVRSDHCIEKSELLALYKAEKAREGGAPHAQKSVAMSRVREYRGWQTKISRTSGEAYYVNTATGESQWEPPSDTPVAESASSSGANLRGSRELLGGMLMPPEAQHVQLARGPDGFGITIRSDAMVLSYTPPPGGDVSSVPVGWFLAAAAGVAVHGREDVLEVLGSAAESSLEFIFVPPPLELHATAVQLTPYRDSVLGIAAASASFNKEKPKLFEHFLIIGAGEDAVARVQQQDKTSPFSPAGAARGLTRLASLQKRAAESVGMAAEPEMLCSFPPVADAALLEQIRDCLTFPDGFRIDTVLGNVNAGADVGEVQQYVFLMHTQAESDGSPVSGAQGAGELRPMYGACIRTTEIVAVTETSVPMPSLSRGLATRRRCHTAPRCHCLLARSPVFEVLFAILRRFLRDEEAHRVRLQQEDADGGSIDGGPVLQVSEHTRPSCVCSFRVETSG